ncbi:MAG: hypothetical protein CM15mP95_0530 [Alphaproteobacteria bacterium]|nr:MAG: hypothetical protein CM15mP95_0530 [Alphaproteobacteria bacterium]
MAAPIPRLPPVTITIFYLAFLPLCYQIRMLKNFTTRHCEFVFQIIIKSISLQETNFLDKQTEFHFTKHRMIENNSQVAPKIGAAADKKFFTNGKVQLQYSGL